VAEAEPFSASALAIRAKALPDEWTTFNTFSSRRRSAARPEEVREAEPCCSRATPAWTERESTIPPYGKDRRPEAWTGSSRFTLRQTSPTKEKWQAERMKYLPEQARRR